jgi:magnesium transporter
MSETVTPSVWEDLIHSQRWEDLRPKLAETHSSDIAEALDQIHGKEQAVVFRILSRDQAAQVFSYLPTARQKALLRLLSTDEVTLWHCAN